MEFNRIPTGTPGLDKVLNGGFMKGKSYLLRGGAGTGKSSLCYAFLREGLQNNESCLLISPAEAKESVMSHAQSVNCDISKASIIDLTPGKSPVPLFKTHSVFNPGEVEGEGLLQEISTTISEQQPDRVVLDSITIFRDLNEATFQYRNLGLSFINYINSYGGTLVVTSELESSFKDEPAKHWVDGVINLTLEEEWRKLYLDKLRGSDYLKGEHTLTISERGPEVFPRLQPKKYKKSHSRTMLSTGNDGVDNLLGGGIENGTTTMITGPTGVGKTSMGVQCLKSAGERNQRAVFYTFEESEEVILERSRNFNMPLESLIESGNLEIKVLEPFDMSPDEFAYYVRKEVENKGTDMVMIDSISGYQNVIKGKDYLKHIHALATYLSNVGVTSILLNETQSVAGEFVTSNYQTSYLVDNILFLRYFEYNGHLSKVIGVLKKKLSSYDSNIREFKTSTQGLEVGDPIRYARGIMSGNIETVQ